MSTDSATTEVSPESSWHGLRRLGALDPQLGLQNTCSPTATNATGSTTAQVQVRVTRPAARLKVKTAAKGGAGARVKVTIRGLEAGERYTIRIGKKKVATGTTKNARPLVRKITLPKASGRATIRVVGDQSDRTGTAKVRIVRR